jgi:peptide-methionine (S)-S-oxide reductase
LGALYEDLQFLEDSVLAARLNGFVKGYGNRENLIQEIRQWNVGEEDRQWLSAELMKLKW